MHLMYHKYDLLRLSHLPLVRMSLGYLLEATLVFPWQLLLESSIFLGNIKWKEAWCCEK